jgi:hypothetical protein
MAMAANNNLKPENVENVWTVNVNNGYTLRNAARLRNLELKERYVNYAKKFPELKQNRNSKGELAYPKALMALQREERNAMKLFTKKNNRRRKSRRL